MDLFWFKWIKQKLENLKDSQVNIPPMLLLTTQLAFWLNNSKFIHPAKKEEVKWKTVCYFVWHTFGIVIKNLLEKLNRIAVDFKLEAYSSRRDLEDFIQHLTVVRFHLAHFIIGCMNRVTKINNRIRTWLNLAIWNEIKT